MSQGFNLKFNQMKENAPTKVGDSESHDSFEYNNSVKNVCFVLADGSMQFFNYGYLISAKYIPDDNVIVLFFTSEIITLEGIKLEGLFFEFMQHLPKQITCTDTRYNAIKDGKSIVNKIDIKPNTN